MVRRVEKHVMRQLVSQARVGRLATVDTDGQPHLVPVCFVLIGERVYTAVDHKPKRTTRLRRLANIAATGRACVLVDHYSDDWDELWWVRLDGTGTVLDNADTDAKAAVAALAAKYDQYAARPPTGPVIGVEVIRWAGWAAR
jgi:PPOX class probable F420-dependent enzyme